MRQKGSTSIFFCLMLLLVSSLLFTLLEGSRMEGLKAHVRMNSSLVTESVLAEYVRPLWEKYNLLVVNGGDESGQWNIADIAYTAAGLGEDNLSRKGTDKSGMWLYPLHLQNVEVTGYRLLTDNNGEGFYEQVVEYMQDNLAIDVVEGIYQKIKEMQDTDDTAGDMDKKVDDAKDCVEEAAEVEEESEKTATTESREITSAEDSVENVSGKKKSEEVSGASRQSEDKNEVSGEWEDGKDEENPLEYIDTWKSAAILTLLGADSAVLSEKKADLDQSLEKRSRQKGNWSETEKEKEGNWYDRILFQEYLLQQFDCYPAGKSEQQENRGVLSYEMEYLIAGKKSDKKNLETVLEKILLLREAANFMYLQTDQVKKNEALALATALVGFTGMSFLIKGVQQGILAVWAFAESVSDVKSLLAGEKIPVVKTAAEWSTDVGKLAKDSDFAKAEKCENGLSYEDYLRVLLFTSNKGKLCYRAMDLIEWDIQSVEGYENLRMDMLWDKCEFQYSYQAAPLFLAPGKNEYLWTIEEKAVYQN